MDWTPERVEELKALHAQGFTASQCAAQFGCTRNAVIGAWHRNGLSRGRTTGSQASPRNRPIHFKAKKAVVAIPEFIPDPACQSILADLTDYECRWPTGEGTATIFCGSPKTHGSYCAHHARLSRRAA